MRFLVDMNLSPAWISFLVDAGFDAIHWSNVGPNDATDGEVMRFAAQNGRIVLTCDLDFGAILASAGGTQPSVVQLRGDLLTPAAIGRAVLSAVKQAEADLHRGALLSVDVARSRLRILPLSDQ